MIILVANEKGGCGKSTTSINMAIEYARRGEDVLYVDGDKQGTGNRFFNDRNEAGHTPMVHCIQKFDNIRETLLDMAKRYDRVIVDTAGRDSREMRTAMTAADVLILPFRPSQADLDLLPRMEELITQAKDLNPNLKVHAIISMAPTNLMVNETREARQYLAEYPEINLLKTIIRDRKVYRDALSEGKGVVELNNPQAKGEIQTLVEELNKW